MGQYSERLFDNSCKDTLPFLSSVSKTEGFLHVVRSCVTLRGVRLEGSRGRPFVLAASGRQKKRDPSLTLRATKKAGDVVGVILRAVRPEGSRGALRSPFATLLLRVFLQTSRQERQDIQDQDRKWQKHRIGLCSRSLVPPQRRQPSS